MAKHAANGGSGHAQVSIAGMVFLRIFLGAFFLYVVFTEKIGDPGGFTRHLADWTARDGLFVVGNPWPAFGQFLATSVHPNAQAAAWLLIFTELFVGAMLLVGLLTRLAGVGALVLSVLYTLATFHLPAEF
ncbi:MAG TPA: TQO small subunit DoxD [Armatimonadota bacterium]|nr:TQO small subunit DoxD [Armatimonadota bacterium]